MCLLLWTNYFVQFSILNFFSFFITLCFEHYIFYVICNSNIIKTLHQYLFKGKTNFNWSSRHILPKLNWPGVKLTCPYDKRHPILVGPARKLCLILTCPSFKWLATVEENYFDHCYQRFTFFLFLKKKKEKNWVFFQWYMLSWFLTLCNLLLQSNLTLHSGYTYIEDMCRHTYDSDACPDILSDLFLYRNYYLNFDLRIIHVCFIFFYSYIEKINSLNFDWSCLKDKFLFVLFKLIT